MMRQVRHSSRLRPRLTSLRQYELDQVQRVLSQSCKQDTPCRTKTIAHLAGFYVGLLTSPTVTAI